MLLIDILVRFPSLTLCVLLVILLARDARRYFQAQLAIGLLVTSIASSLHTMPSELGLPTPIYVVALFVSVPASAFEWCFARSMLEDRFRTGPIDWSIMTAACLFKLGWSLQGIGIVLPVHGFRYIGSYTVNILMVLYILWIAISGLQNDLVEQRRRVRYWFILFFAFTGGANLVMELAGYSGAIEAIFIHATTLPIMLWVVIWLSRLTPEKLFYMESENLTDNRADVPERMGAAYQRLTRLMEIDRGFIDHDLTVGRLADKVGLPEHQLRRLINQTLGYRNFATYLNTYRLAHAKAALADPDKAQIPILTLAMDAGYKTLSTFNRAFKAAENETPSDFRKRLLRERLAERRSETLTSKNEKV